MADLIDRATELAEAFDTQKDVEQNPCGAWMAIQELHQSIAALPAQGVRVRALEWHQTSETPARWLGHQIDASNPDYVIHLTADDPDVYSWGLHGEGWHGFCDTLDEAKAAAQADYERRILAAIRGEQA